MATLLSEILSLHLRRVASLYPDVTPGRNMTGPNTRSGSETLLWDEMLGSLRKLREYIAEISRPRSIKVNMGWPKPAWAHVYYLSFHDPANSNGPTQGFYPVFLMSTDQRICWLSVCLAAASVGISGRGGWRASYAASY